MTHRLAAAAALAVVLTFGVAGCSGPKVAFVPDGKAQTLQQVEAAASRADVSSVSSIEVEKAPEERAKILEWLRSQGASGAKAATLLTRGFPDHVASVPVLVEIANVDGVRSLIAVEAFGQDGEPLKYRRLWVFDLGSGKVTYSSAYR